MARLTPAVVLAAALVAAAPCGAETLPARWRSPSRLTPVEASVVLYRHAEGRRVRAEDLLEAEKHFRTDGPVSPAQYVLTEVLTRLLGARFHGEDARLRVLPPVLHWLESAETTQGVRLRGETVQVAVLNSPPRRAVTVLYHHTIHQQWTICGADVCVSNVGSPLRRQVGYSMSVASPVTEVASTFASLRLIEARLCDPHPTEIADSGPESPFGLVIRHAAAETMPGAANEISCTFEALPSKAPARVSYTVSAHLAAPPSRAARGAVVNNPLEFSLTE